MYIQLKFNLQVKIGSKCSTCKILPKPSEQHNHFSSIDPGLIVIDVPAQCR